MKLVSGSILLLAAEQAFAHAQMTAFPNHDVASRVLIPASVTFLIVGALVFAWGVFTETMTRQSASDGNGIKA